VAGPTRTDEPAERPPVGNGGSADELGWEEPTRPDRPFGADAQRPGAAGAGRQQGDVERAPKAPERGDPIDEDTR
jgi:hypothetical protein